MAQYPELLEMARGMENFAGILRKIAEGLPESAAESVKIANSIEQANLTILEGQPALARIMTQMASLLDSEVPISSEYAH